MSFSDFSLFLPGSTNNTLGSKNIVNKNQLKNNIQKIQSNFKKLIDTIIILINDKKKLESELTELKTTSQKQKNISLTSKNSQELLKYIGILDNYLIEVNKTLKDHPNEKAEILSKIQHRINQNFGSSPKNKNQSELVSISENINFGITPQKENNSSNFSTNFNSKFKNNKSASTLEELMGVNYEQNNNSIQEKLFLNNNTNRASNLNTVIGNVGNGNANRASNVGNGNAAQASNLNTVLGNVGNGNAAQASNLNTVLGNIRNVNANRASNLNTVLGNVENGNAARVSNVGNGNAAQASNLNTVLGNIRNRNANRASNVGNGNAAQASNLNTFLGNVGNGNANRESNVGNGNANRASNVGNGNANRASNVGNGNANRASNVGNGNAAQASNVGNGNANRASNVNTVLGNVVNGNSNKNNSGKRLTNFLGENNRNRRVIEMNEEENVENQQQPRQNSNKTILESIGETLGLTSTTTPQNNSNNVKINMKKAKCEGEDCDIFSEDVETAEINTANLGRNFGNGENRYNNARKKIMKLLGEQVIVSKTNNRGKISNFPREGDINTYLEET